MEDNSSTTYSPESLRISLYLDPLVLDLLVDVPESETFSITSNLQDAVLALDIVDSKLTAKFHGQSYCSLPITKTNALFMLSGLKKKLAHASHAPVTIDQSVAHQLLGPCLPALLSYSNNSEFSTFLQHLTKTLSLKNVLDSVLKLRHFQQFPIAYFLLHQKGEPHAWKLGTQDGLTSSSTIMDLENFNALNVHIKKSKSRSFSTHGLKKVQLPLSGTFLAQNLYFKKFNVIFVLSRGEFLPFSDQEITEFSHFSRLFYLFIEPLLQLEFSDLKIAEVFHLLDLFPAPLSISNPAAETIFSNQLSTNLSESGPYSQKRSLIHNYQLNIQRPVEVEDSHINIAHQQKIALLGDLFNTLRHELSNPLFGLGLACELLLSHEDVPPDTLTMLQEIKKSITRCQMLIQNLSQLYSHQFQGESSSLERAINEVLTLAKSELKQVKKEIKWQQGLIPETIKVQGQPIIIVQILFNLLVNSAQAMKNITIDPKLRIEISKHNEQIHILVSDNGPGLPEKIKQNLFHPFITTKERGHGIGLALARNLTLKIGEQLEYLENSQLGGAAFLIRLREFHETHSHH